MTPLANILLSNEGDALTVAALLKGKTPPGVQFKLVEDLASDPHQWNILFYGELRLWFALECWLAEQQLDRRTGVISIAMQ